MRVSVQPSSSSSQQLPPSDGNKLLGEVEEQRRQQREDVKQRRKDRAKFVPSLPQALQLLPTASWLQIRNDDVHDLKSQITAEVTNLGLILALLCTIFMPLYYTEVSRIDSSDDTFYMDVTDSHVFPNLAIGFDFIHDYFDVCYCVAACASFLGTLFSIFLQLALNECSGDEAVAVFLKRIGRWVSAPYYCLNLCGIGWGFTIYMHITLTARTGVGLALKLGAGSAMVLWGTHVIGSYVQAVYEAAWEDDNTPAKAMSDGELEVAVSSFFNPQEAACIASSSRSATEFLDSLRPLSDGGYKVRLEAVTQARALYIYYQHLSRVSGVPIDFLREIMHSSSS